MYSGPLYAQCTLLDPPRRHNAWQLGTHSHAEIEAALYQHLSTQFRM